VFLKETLGIFRAVKQMFKEELKNTTQSITKSNLKENKTPTKFL